MSEIDVVMLANSKDVSARKMTENALKTLHASSENHKFNVFLIETSTDDIQYSGAQVIHGSTPFNYNVNVNIGLKYCKNDWVVISNNDLLFYKNWIDPILELGCDSASPMSPDWGPHFGMEGKVSYGYRVGLEVAGWCMVMKKSTIDAVGKFDEQFASYYQDNDLAMNLREKRLLHALVGTSRVKHLVGQTFGGYHTKAVRKEMRRSEELYNKKWATRPSTSCLTMIVKDESKIILEALESVYKFIDYWVIVDTGSTDDTREKIVKFFNEKGISGELHDRPWKNFGHNRTEALQLADGKADYMVMMDADDIIVGDINFRNLTADFYIVKHGDEFVFWRAQIFRSGMKWRYEGVLHETPASDIAKVSAKLLGSYNWISRTAGSRNNDPLKYQKDAQILEDAIIDEPNNSRYWFYLAQSYFDAHDFVNAKRCYAKRASMGGWNEEVYYAQFRVGLCAINLKESDDQIINEMLRAHEIRPTRAEAVNSLAVYLRTKNRHALGHAFSVVAAGIPFPATDSLFVHGDVYKWRAIEEQAICAFWLGRIKECYDISKIMLTRNLPMQERLRIEANIKSCEERLKK